MFKGNDPSLNVAVIVDIMCLNPTGCWLKEGNLISFSRSLDVGSVSFVFNISNKYMSLGMSPRLHQTPSPEEALCDFE